MSQALPMIEQPITTYVWRDKYRFGEEKSRSESLERVARGVFPDESESLYYMESVNMMEDGVWAPAGRIHAGAGTGKRVTLINCYVSPTIQDSMATEAGKPGHGIMDALKYAAITQQMGGGIGTDFSTVRPEGAIVARTGSVSTGVLPFMSMQDAMCRTIKSSGSRRGAMMGTLRIDHGDVLSFIKAKREKGQLTNFNVSVLVTDKFMEHLKNGQEWEMGFLDVPKADGTSYRSGRFPEGVNFQVYKVMPAREVWDLLIRSTYEHAEPGVIFIDRVNYWNNLWYTETISCTNPCGEQPLPPNGACNLGSVNLAVCVIDPFTENARIDFDKIASAARLGMRFLDKVLDVTQFPTEEQAKESKDKRRTGLGITGLANLFQQMRVRYGSTASEEMAGMIMRTIMVAAYDESVEMARDHGPFPLFDAEKYLQGNFIKQLPEELKEKIRIYGIRNSVLLTIAPNGTISLYYGNLSSGCEPTFDWSYTRKVLVGQDSYQEYRVVDYGMLLYEQKFGKVDTKNLKNKPLPDYMVTAMELTVDEHVKIQAVLQKYIDSSISKTINCPTEMSYEDFKDVYLKAYQSGLKGCTTYRPNPDSGRGSVLVKDTPVKGKVAEKTTLIGLPEQRPDTLLGSTYKVKWASIDQAFYITINDVMDDSGQMKPFEIFINSKSVQHQEWIAALTRTISAVFRRGGDVTFLVDELAQVHSTSGGQWINQKYVPSLVAMIAKVMENHFKKIGLMGVEALITQVTTAEPDMLDIKSLGSPCPSCSAPAYVKSEGCGICKSCGYSDCG